MEQTERTFYYVACATGEKHILEEAQYSLKSLIKTGVPVEDIYFIVNTEKDKKVIADCISELTNVFVADIDLSIVKWRYMRGRRKFSFFKAASLKKFFAEPKSDRHMVYFDTDVLFFKNPFDFLFKRKDKTWFHHGKINAKVSKKRNNGKPIKAKNINMKKKKSLSIWVSEPCAYLMIKHGAKKLPPRQVCAGFYILHPSDHSKLIKTTYKYCKEIVGKFINSPDVGDQKPMNAAISVLDIDYAGGSRFECPEHIEYFNHYFGKKKQKNDFKKKIQELFFEGGDE